MLDRFDANQNLPSELPTRSLRVHCRSCDSVFALFDLRWDHRRGLWVCAYWPDCDGAGYGCDLHDGEAVQ